jgi:hypothetical protein
MTLLLKSQRMLREPELARGDVLECEDRDGQRVPLTVTLVQPRLPDGRWVNGLTDGDPAVVWVTW